MPRKHATPPSTPAPFAPATPVVIGLMGGVASGKSTIAGLFAARGLRHVDADRHARLVLQRPDVVRAVAVAFGPDALGTDGSVDRKALAARVFADSEARRRLEAITHPAIRAEILAELAAARAARQSVLLDVPLLLENGLIEHCDVTVFVAAANAARRARALARGWAEGELERREAAQAPLAVKSARAGHSIRNDGDLADTARQVDALLATLAASPSSPSPPSSP